MKNTVKPIKSIRQAILTTLNNQGEITVDGMLDQIQGFDRKSISSNVAQLVTEQLATRRKDDFTGAPAYRITDLGKSRIKSDSTTLPMPVSTRQTDLKVTLTTQPAKPVVKENLTTQSANALVTVSAEKITEIEAAIDAGQAENGRLRAALKESEQVRENHAKSLLDLECEKIELLRENSALRESQSAGVTRIDALSEELDTVVTECNRLKSESMALTVLNESMPGFGAAYTEAKSTEQQVTVEQFMIRVPKRKPMVVKSFEKARQRAMSAAKSVGKVEVYAMVEVGHAVRGAVWNQTQVI